jgi:hypothetical protein
MLELHPQAAHFSKQLIFGAVNHKFAFRQNQHPVANPGYISDFM